MKNIVAKSFIICILALSGFISLIAQPSNQSVLSFGIKSGINISKINFDPPVDQDLTLGFTGGLVVKYVSETHAGIQTEFNYSQRGWAEQLDSSNTYKRRLNYFEIPILTHFVFGGEKTKGFLNIGPNLSFYSSGKEEFHLPTADSLLYYQRNLDKRFELGLLAGIGMLQSTSIGDFQLEFRFHYGLQNIFSTDIQTNLAKSQNLLYGITLSYFFFVKDYKTKKE